MKIMQCPVPDGNASDKITLAHGGGGKLTDRLIREVFYPAFNNRLLGQAHDGAVITLPENRIAYSTDSFVVDPIFFPGGNIGDLAVNGTVNDLACCGARPLYLSAGFILEEGFPIGELVEIVRTMALAAEKAEVQIVTGDTKVVERGKCDKIYINTSGIGVVPKGVEIGPTRAKAGDAVILTGRIGEHGIAVLSQRENLGFESAVKSDTAPLNRLVSKLLAVIPEIHVLRDPTRGGVASTLNEIAETAGVCIEIDESQLPISEAVTAACDLLGLDPLFVANEGILLVFLPEEAADEAVALLRKLEYGRSAAIIGRVTDCPEAIVTLRTTLGNSRVIDRMTGEQLPRIC